MPRPARASWPRSTACWRRRDPLHRPRRPARAASASRRDSRRSASRDASPTARTLSPAHRPPRPEPRPPEPLAGRSSARPPRPRAFASPAIPPAAPRKAGPTPAELMVLPESGRRLAGAGVRRTTPQTESVPSENRRLSTRPPAAFAAGPGRGAGQRRPARRGDRRLRAAPPPQGPRRRGVSFDGDDLPGGRRPPSGRGVLPQDDLPGSRSTTRRCWPWRCWPSAAAIASAAAGFRRRARRTAGTTRPEGTEGR